MKHILKRFYKSHKASLNLSVNAIVIFVLAFAMLGVGLFVTNMLRENLGDAITGVVPTDEFRTPPDALTPVVFGSGSSKVVLDNSADAKLKVGIYNKYGSASDEDDQSISIDKCVGGAIDSSSSSSINLAAIMLGQTIEPGKWKGFEVQFDVANENNLQPGNTYTCNLKIVLGTGMEYTKQVTLKISS